MRSPSARADASGLRTTRPIPSLRTNPSACESKDRHRPVGERTPALLKLMANAGERIKLAPPATAISASPFHRALQARCTATSDEEHAVSTAMLGPRQSK